MRPQPLSGVLRFANGKRAIWYSGNESFNCGATGCFTVLSTVDASYAICETNLLSVRPVGSDARCSRVKNTGIRLI